MEEKCGDSINSFTLDGAHPSSGVIASTVESVNDYLLDQPSTSSASSSSMSLLREDFVDSRHDFAEVLDDETTTSGVLETFEISSSNSLPNCLDANADVAIDDSSTTDTIKLVEVSDGISCNNDYFNVSDVYVINDDDDDDEDDGSDVVVSERETEGMLVAHAPSVNPNSHHVEENINRKQLRMSTENTGSQLGNQINSVIVTNGGATIYLETPVVEEQQHHPQLINLSAGQSEFVEKTGKPKCLNDEFMLTDDAIQTVQISRNDGNNLCDNINNECSDAPVLGEHVDTVILDDVIECSTSELLPDRMSFRLRKMNINNSNSSTQRDCDSRRNMPSGSKCNSNDIALLVPSMADIESMDLIERRDFETEQRLTGGIILKSSTLINKNVLNLSLIKPCMQPHNSGQSEQINLEDDCPSSSSNSNSKSNNNSGSNVGRVVSSDSKCAYKDPTSTPTSSRIYNSRLTKSTAKLNLCSTLSQHQHQKHHQDRATKPANNKSSSLSSSTLTSSSASASSLLSSSSSSTSSVIVEAPSTSAGLGGNNSSCTMGSGGVEVYSNSNSNDSLMGGNTVAHVGNCHQDNQRKQHQNAPLNKSEEGGCSRTSSIHAVVAEVENNAAIYDDAQPSTSSGRCQYATPSKSMRQVNASAQTNERYLTRAPALNGGSAMNIANATAPSSSGSSIFHVTNKSRRRAELPTNASATDEVMMNAIKIMTEAVAAAAAAEMNDESSWADCEENNSDLEEICTCHHSSSSGSDSSLGGSNTSLNETDDADTSYVGSGRDGDLSNYIQMVSISEETSGIISDYMSACPLSNAQQRKRKYNEGRALDNDASTAVSSSGATLEDVNSRKRIAYDYASTPCSSQVSGAPSVIPSTPSTSQLVVFANSTPPGKRTPRSIIPTRENPQPELQNWLSQFTQWTNVERLLAINRLIEHCEPTQVRHMMKVIEPQFQRDFISLLPRELALQVLSYLEPKDLLRAAQTCRSWRFLCDDNLLWKEKCRKAQILTEPRTDRPKRGRAGNMPPIASPWKAAYMRQHIIEMNWRSRPIREPKVLRGHDDHVITCLQFSSNRIVSGSDDNTLKVWSAVSGRCLRTLVGHTGGVWSSQMSGNIIISGSTDRTLKVWDMDTGQCLHTLLGHTSTVRCMHLHGNKVVSGSRDATLRVWDIEQGTCLHVLVGHLAAVRCVQYDGKLIVSGAYDYMVKIWHPERQECLHTLSGHTNRVYSLQFDGTHVVSGSLDTSIRVWDVETGNCRHTLMGHQSLTSGMELRQNILVSGNADSTVKVWDITTGQCLQTLSGPNKHQSAVTCLQFNSRFVVTSSDDGTVKLWDVKTGEFIRNLVALESGGSGGVVWRIRANDTKLICAVGSRNGTEETKLMVLDFDVEGACVKCS